MQITTTAIKHKRYSTYGWNALDNEGKFKNTLAVGEIGILLGHKKADGSIIEVTELNSYLLNTILEVRIGSAPPKEGQSGQYFFDALIIDTDYTVKTVAILPNWGRPNCLYINTSDNIAYYWDNDKMIPLIGGSGSDIQDDLSNYVKKIDLEAQYYNKDQIDEKVSQININISQLDQKIAALEGTTYFAGAGPLNSRPSSAKNGAIYVATDNSKEYIWVDTQWVELGDVTEESKRISSLENSLKDRPTIAQVATDIANAKIDAINSALEQSKIYTNSKNAEILQIVEETTSNLQNKIDESNAKFNDYYNREETDTLVSNNSINNVNLIYGWDSALTSKSELPEIIL